MEKQAEYNKEQEKEQELMTVKRHELPLRSIKTIYQASLSLEILGGKSEEILIDLEVGSPFSYSLKLEEKKKDLYVLKNGESEVLKSDIVFEREYLINRLFKYGLHLQSFINIFVRKNHALATYIKPVLKKDKSKIILPDSAKNKNKREALVKDLQEDANRVFIEKIGENDFNLINGDIVSLHPNVSPVPVVVDGITYLLINLDHIQYADNRYRNYYTTVLEGIESVYSNMPERVTPKEYETALYGESDL